MSEDARLNPAPAKTPLDFWAAPPGDVRLREDEVHIWRAKLGRAEAEVQRLCRRSRRTNWKGRGVFRFEEHRHHFVVARGLLRSIISLYLGVEPRQVRFCYSPYGKPSLAHEPDNGLRFNLSHSSGLALYAVTRSIEVGIDIEHMRTEFEGMEIAARFFSRREVAALESLPQHLRAAAFFNCWTRKEAYIKARGEGLSLPLDEFDVSLTPGEPAALLHTAKDPREAGRWSLRELRPARVTPQRLPWLDAAGVLGAGSGRKIETYIPTSRLSALAFAPEPFFIPNVTRPLHETPVTKMLDMRRGLSVDNNPTKGDT